VNRGRLVAFEGIDGCGKSTQVARLAASLRAAGHDLLATGEPTDGPTGRRIREMARSGRTLAPEAELRWFVEDRRVHVAEVIAPALAAGRAILTDRYFLSTVAYQGARGLDWRQILADSEAEFPIPDRVIVLEIEPAQALARIEARGAPIEGVFEHGDLLERVAEIFRSIDRDYLVRVDGSADPAAVEQSIRALDVLG
jgi:dTMP kinase